MKTITSINKRGQGAIEMSFGWIFSIILIAVFIFVAIYGIMYFIDIANYTKVETFYKNLQTNVDNAYSSPSYNFVMDVSIPGIKKVCFVDLSSEVAGSFEEYRELLGLESTEANIFLFPSEKAHDKGYKYIKHLNISRMTERKNPLCFDISNDGNFQITKEFYDRGVVIK